MKKIMSICLMAGAFLFAVPKTSNAYEVPGVTHVTSGNPSMGGPMGWGCEPGPSTCFIGDGRSPQVGDVVLLNLGNGHWVYVTITAIAKSQYFGDSHGGQGDGTTSIITPESQTSNTLNPPLNQKEKSNNDGLNNSELMVFNY